MEIDGQDDSRGEEGTRPPASMSSKQHGFEYAGWRALEQAYARDVLPHPYFHQDYLDIVEIKLLPDRKTFQLWYRPKPSDRVTADEIAEAVTKHGAAFKAMLARHAPRSSSPSSRLVFQLVRQSDRQADMPDLWRKLEEQVRLHHSRQDHIDSDDNGQKDMEKSSMRSRRRGFK
ncbi:hypothetical protein FBU30_006922 [Linnemannia zychae]|nr:hypothetical protein FBU30_006922 [Linnemannia zychae]